MLISQAHLLLRQLQYRNSTSWKATSVPICTGHNVLRLSLAKVLKGRRPSAFLGVSEKTKHLGQVLGSGHKALGTFTLVTEVEFGIKEVTISSSMEEPLSAFLKSQVCLERLS